MWNITVNAGEELPINLVFKPTKQTQHSFHLPVSILGMFIISQLTNVKDNPLILAGWLPLEVLHHL